MARHKAQPVATSALAHLLHVAAGRDSGLSRGPGDCKCDGAMSRGLWAGRCGRLQCRLRGTWGGGSQGGQPGNSLGCDGLAVETAAVTGCGDCEMVPHEAWAASSVLMSTFPSKETLQLQGARAPTCSESLSSHMAAPSHQEWQRGHSGPWPSSRTRSGWAESCLPERGSPFCSAMSWLGGAYGQAAEPRASISAPIKQG